MIEFKNYGVSDKEKLIQIYCSGKNVLDIGSIGQDTDFKSPNWVHAKIKKVANQIVGVDLNIEGIENAKKENFEIILPEQLNLQEKYDVITMFDVIEHVDNILNFINFYKTFASKNGILIITTPNPFNLRQLFNILFFGKPSVNEEHTSWIDPINFIEISKRSNTKIHNFFWVNEYTPSDKFYWKFLTSFVFPIFMFFRRYLYPNYAIILTVNE